ncbi:MAG TPA: glutamate 5-kinase [Polyangiaceae bacterium]|jgi:glutamate 5-kinase|nr:glutamate 5-kinase [Polyangiaceae bacterium]
MHSARVALTKAQRIVIKVGSRSLAGDGDLVAGIARQIAALTSERRAFVVVTSGAIALGVSRLGYRKRPKEMPRLQAAAAAGQGVLMQRYSVAFGAEGLVAAQVLLTHADLADRERVNNARQALAALIDAGAVPVINENDTVSTEEIRFGDNDQLASMVAPLVSADLLMLLTDVEGVLDDAGQRIAVMSEGAKIGTVTSASGPGTGGMTSKLDAATKASRAGASVVIAPAMRENVITDVVMGKDVGTLILPHPSTLRARQHWIMYTLRPRGDVLLDEGAARALAVGKSSLLPIGVLGVRGDFHAGDAVRLVTPAGAEVGRGLARMSSIDVARAARKKGDELDAVLGREGRDQVVVHKDDLVVIS